MNFNIISPTQALIEGSTGDDIDSLTKQLSYTNTASQHQLKRHYANHWFRSKNPDGWKTTLEALKDDVHHCLLYKGDSHYIRPGSIPYLTGLSFTVNSSIKYPIPKKVAWAKPLPFELYDYQEKSWQELIRVRHGNVELCTGCHAKGTQILMFDGTLKNVEDVKVGDQLMGPDSRPRNVLELHRGMEEMYEIRPNKGEPFAVNRGHILSLQRTNWNSPLRKNGTRASQENGKNPILNISVADYLKLSDRNKDMYKLYRVGVEFCENDNLKIPPYILGIWLGDGSSAGASLTTMDQEIKEEWCNYLSTLNLNISVYHKENDKASSYGGIVENLRPRGRIKKGQQTPRRQNEFNALLNDYDLLNKKHIPLHYLTSSRKNRLELLAGLIDTDGYYHNGYFEIIQKNRILAKNIVYLAKSLGFGVNSREKESHDQNGTVGNYIRITIMGDLDVVPVKLKRKRATVRKNIKSVLRTGFSIKEIGKGKYFGFSVDSDSLYLMGDFTVTHNSGKSAIILKICRETGFRTAIIAPSQPIFLELLEKFEHHFGRALVGAFGDGKKTLGKKFTICIDDSIANIKPDTPEWEFFSTMEMFCADESHTWGAETLEKICHGVLGSVPYRMFFSGTQTRGDGAEKLLQSIIGQTVCTLTTEEAVRKGYICPHEFRIVEIESSNPNYTTSDAIDMKRIHFLRNTNICAFIARLAAADARTNRRQSLVLVEELSQVVALSKLLEAAGIPTAVAHSEKNAKRLIEVGLVKVDRKESIDKFNRGEAMVLIGTSCISTGTNIYPTHNTFNWQGGTSEIKTKQGAVGRSVRLGKANPWAAKCLEKLRALIWDFKIVGIYIMEAHLEDRVGYYSDSGSEVKTISLRK